MIRLLTDEEKEGLVDVFQAEFDDSLVPDYVVGIVENGEVQSFIVVEQLLRVGLIWSKDEIRQTPKAAANSLGLMKYVYRSIPKGQSAIVIASDEKFEPILKKIGMREIEGKVFRKDF